MNHSEKNNIPKKKRNGIFRKWHRRMGFLASLFLLNLAVTGILLNHYEWFGFHRRHIESDWLLSLYGVQAPNEVKCLGSASFSVCQIGQFVYIQGQFWQEDPGTLLAASETAEGIALATTYAVYQLTKDRRVIESQAFSDSLNEPVTKAQLSNIGLVVETENVFYVMSLDTMELRPLAPHETANLSQPMELKITAELLTLLQSDYRTRQISELQFIQDLHSGSLFSLPGKLTNDITAVLLLLLAVSGFITWQRRRSR